MKYKLYFTKQAKDIPTINQFFHFFDKPAKIIPNCSISAGTWINMQEAYIQEKNAVGDWVQIGYSAPGTKGSTNYEYASNVIAYSSEESAATWVATPVAGVKLNDCENGETWTLSAGLDAGGSLAIEAPTADNDADCTVLTASWDNLTKGTIASTGSASGSN